MTNPTERADWPEAIATVLSCTYDARAGRAMAFGLTSKKHFRITYNYWVGDEVHTGELFAAEAMPQGTLFPLRYDPDLPRIHRSTDGAAPANRVPLLAFGIAGSIVLSLVWFLVMRGCG